MLVLLLLILIDCSAPSVQRLLLLLAHLSDAKGTYAIADLSDAKGTHARTPLRTVHCVSTRGAVCRAMVAWYNEEPMCVVEMSVYVLGRRYVRTCVVPFVFSASRSHH